MPSSAERSVLFFRIYREATLPLYAAVVEELCVSPHLPFQLATVLEDIGQEFIRLGALVNAALDRLGLLEHEVDADLTVEAQIDTVMSRLATSGPFMSTGCGYSGSILTDATLQRALRMALIMTHDLPIAEGP
ncbi:hypothetical protein [Methylobacterium radiotolerans]|uniref:hypothetical protein n=1 Tax=Methylobacterium radiotolerans TaxID=31998 RepID=UPI001115A8B0|nr:hypothetical protein [Methylobacterium radiotolerans]